MMRICILGFGLFLLIGGQSPAVDLLEYRGSRLVVTEWADGDSFRVRLPDGEEHTFRLYGVDCFETVANDATDARRLRAQRRYFGISGFGGDPVASNDRAKQRGIEAKAAVQNLLRKPFIVRTVFADAGGDGRFKRHYAFIELGDGTDLGEALVERGLARAFGVYRRKSAGVSANEYRKRLQDLELTAAKQGDGAWADTDWKALPGERRLERKEAEELAAARGGPKLPPNFVDPNKAPRDLLMQLPGIGEELANRIIEAREQGPYATAEDLRRVPGIGPKKLEGMRAILKFEE